MAQKGNKRGKKKLPEPDTAEVVEALNHPLRRKVLRAIHGNKNEPISPVTLSKELGEDLSSVSYHVTVLLQKKSLTQVGTRQRRGAMEHFYISTITGDKVAKIVLEQTKDKDEGGTSRRRKRA